MNKDKHEVFYDFNNDSSFDFMDFQGNYNVNSFPNNLKNFDFLSDNANNQASKITKSNNYQVFLLLIVQIAGILGNLLVCLSVALEKKLRTITNFILISLATADLFVSIIVIPGYIAQEFKGFWPFGLVTCTIWQMCDVTMCTSSIFHMCLISFDRYRSIKNPISTIKRTKFFFFCRIFLAWTLSFSISSPLVFLAYISPDQILNKGEQCVISNNNFLIYGSLCAFFLPLSIMLITYTLTIKLLRSKQQHNQVGLRRSLSSRKGSKKHLKSPLYSPQFFSSSLNKSNLYNNNCKWKKNEDERSKSQTLPPNKSSHIYISTTKSVPTKPLQNSIHSCQSFTNTSNFEDKFFIDIEINNNIDNNETYYYNKKNNDHNNNKHNKNVICDNFRVINNINKNKTSSNRNSINFIKTKSEIEVINLKLLGGKSCDSKTFLPFATNHLRSWTSLQDLNPLLCHKTSQRIKKKKPENYFISKAHSSIKKFSAKYLSDSVIYTKKIQSKKQRSFCWDPKKVYPSFHFSSSNGKKVNEIQFHTKTNNLKKSDFENYQLIKRKFENLPFPNIYTNPPQLKKKINSLQKNETDFVLHYHKNDFKTQNTYKSNLNKNSIIKKYSLKTSLNGCSLLSDFSFQENNSQNQYINPNDNFVKNINNKKNISHDYKTNYKNNCEKEEYNFSNKNITNYKKKLLNDKNIFENLRKKNLLIKFTKKKKTQTKIVHDLNEGENDLEQLKLETVISRNKNFSEIKKEMEEKKNRPKKGHLIQSKSVRTEKKAVKVLGLMFFFFVCCWFFFFCMNLTMGLCPHCFINDDVFRYLLLLGYFSSIINPVIYTIFNYAFRQTFVRILTFYYCFNK